MIVLDFWQQICVVPFVFDLRYCRPDSIGATLLRAHLSDVATGHGEIGAGDDAGVVAQVGVVYRRQRIANGRIIEGSENRSRSYSAYL